MTLSNTLSSIRLSFPYYIMEKIIIAGMKMSDNVGNTNYSQNLITSRQKMAAIIGINVTPEESSKLI